MSNLIFPEGITYEYGYVVGGDYLPANTTLTKFGNLYISGGSNIIYIPFDTSNITNLSYAFSNSRIKSIKYFDTSNVTDMSYMFQSCSNLTTIPQLDTSNVTNMYGMFSSCSNLTTIPQLDTSNVTDMESMFQSCSKLTSLPLLDCSNVTKLGTYFGYGTNTSLTYLGGFKDLGKQTSVSGLNTGYFLRALPNITYDSIMNVINNLYDRASAGMSTLPLYIHADTMKLLSDSDKAIATNKGWTLS